MIRRQRDIAIGPPEDATSFELVSGDTIKVEVPPQVMSGFTSASA